jgi:hypothetical protein
MSIRLFHHHLPTSRFRQLARSGDGKATEPETHLTRNGCEQSLEGRDMASFGELVVSSLQCKQYPMYGSCVNCAPPAVWWTQAGYTLAGGDVTSYI